MKKKIDLLALLAISLTPTPALAQQEPQVVVTATDLRPGAALSSEAYAVTGERVAGVVNTATAILNGYGIPTWHAVSWSGSTNTLADLHPGGYTNLSFLGTNPPVPYPPEDLHPGWPTWSQVYAAAEAQQVGSVFFGSPLDPFQNVANHAASWSGTAESFQDLHPNGYAWSWALATSGRQQAGIVYQDIGSLLPHAALWSGSAASFVDLNPAGATASGAEAISDDQQAGWVRYGGQLSSARHAAIWYGTPGSFVDLHPSEVDSSVILSTSGNEQVGEVGFGQPLDIRATHAGLWSGRANSFLDLNPPGATDSSAKATTGDLQAGYADFGGGRHAGIWMGTPDSFVDLHAVLDSSRYVSSEARAMWANGSTIRVAGTAEVIEPDVGFTVSHAMLWTIALPDTTPPSITRAWASRSTLWPPNHRMVQVQISATVEDNSGEATWSVIGAFSNEPQFDSRDIVISSGPQISLRAARCATGDGRVYAVLLQAQDPAGNLSRIQRVTIEVPRDSRHH